MNLKQLGAEIEEIRQKNRIPLYIVCDLFCVNESKWFEQIVAGKRKPTTYQLIMFIEMTKTPLKSL